MNRGLHLLGADAKRMASAVTAALAEGLAQGATHSRGGDAASQAQVAQARAAEAQAQARAAEAKASSSNTMWYVAGGAAVLAVVVALLVRSR